MLTRLLATVFANLSLAFVFGIGGMAALVRVYGDDLPGTKELRDYRPNMLSRVYSGKGEIIAEYAKERRIFVPIDEVPEIVKQAFISAEDKNFYKHPGVDASGIAKAFGRFFKARLAGRPARLSGASTITQQVMKNFLVGDERSVERKIREGILAVRVGKVLSKDQILELYLNEIAFGLRSHGIVAAAENYFGKTLENLTVEEAAYLAGLPKGPNNYHPVRDHRAATIRRNYVIGQMAENGYLTPAEAERLKKLPLKTIVDENRPVLIQRTSATYFADEVRRQLIRDVGEDMLYRGGLTVRATIDDKLQAIAIRALRRGLEKFDRGLGVYRGPVARLKSVTTAGAGTWKEKLAGVNAPRDIAGWHLGVVLQVGGDNAIVGVAGLTAKDGSAGTDRIELSARAERRWIRSTHIEARRPRSAAGIWAVGDVIYVARGKRGWGMRQIPEVQGAFMAMDPHSGRVLALMGGFSRAHSSFNRATQAQRQPGSSFKPLVYAAALDIGYTPETLVNDAPIKVGTGETTWRPKNSSGSFRGQVSLRTALAASLNLVTVRLAMDLGMDRVGEYARRFGVYDNMPAHLSYSLGAGETTLYQIVAAYGMFANGGKRVRPTVIDRVQDRHGKTLFRLDTRECQGCQVRTFGAGRTPILFDRRNQIMDPLTAFKLIGMMRGVVEGGTASRTVGGLGFPVAGKTGTTNDSKDAWFVGFTKNLVAGCFIGYDTPRSMGRAGYGGKLCGPVFREFMKAAYKERPPGEFTPPPGYDTTITVKVHRDTGERLSPDAEGDFVVVQTYKLGSEPEILVKDRREISDFVLFKDSHAELLSKLPEGDDVPLATKSDKAGTGGTRPAGKNVGLGTGGLY